MRTAIILLGCWTCTGSRNCHESWLLSRQSQTHGAHSPPRSFRSLAKFLLARSPTAAFMPVSSNGKFFTDPPICANLPSSWAPASAVTFCSSWAQPTHEARKGVAAPKMETSSEKASELGASASSLVASSAFLAAIMSLEAGRLATDGVPTCVIAASAGIIASSISFFLINGEGSSKKSPAGALLAAQSLLGGLLPHLAFFSISKSGLAVANTLMFTMPLWTAIFAFLATGVPWRRSDILLSLSSMLGVILVVWPGSGALPFSSLGVLAGLAFGACGGGLNILVGSTALRNSSPQRLNALQMGATAVLSVPQLWLRLGQTASSAAVPFQSLQWSVMLARLGAVGGLMTATGMLRTKGLQRARSSSVSVLLFTEIAWCFLLDILIVGARPGLSQLLGAFLVVGGPVTSALLQSSEE